MPLQPTDMLPIAFFDLGAIGVRMMDGDQSVMVMVSDMALIDRSPKSAALAAFVKNRGLIEQIASQKYDRNLMTAEHQIMVSSKDLNG